jgi:hypothetical protein
LLGPFTITATAGAGGMISPSGAVPVACGASQAFTIVADEHYHVLDVLVDGTPVTPVPSSFTFSDVQANHTIAASFSIDIYTLTVTKIGSGTVTPDAPGLYTYGTVVTLTATAADGWHFVEWGGDTSGTVSPTTVTMTSNKSVTATFEANPAVAPVANLVATQVRSGNAPGSTTAIVLTWNATAPGTSVEVWRAGFGHYPEYDDAGGAIPTASSTYPPGGDWELTAVTAPADTDRVGIRDFYYYVAYAKDGYGTWSPGSNQTPGTLNYHLGDVTDGYTEGVGNNRVYTEDISLLGANYGATGASLVGYEYLDVGPTTDMSVFARPVTDGIVNFEDLVMFAMNYGVVSAPNRPALLAGGQDELSLQVTETVPGTLVAHLRLQGTGLIQALSAALSWDPAVVEPTGFAAGQMLTDQGGIALSAAPGSVDVAILGMHDPGLTGTGEIATITFNRKTAGSAGIGFASVIARNSLNAPVPVSTSGTTPVPGVMPTVTAFAAPSPNPFPARTTLSFSLAKSGAVELEIFSVDGRKVRTLVREVREPGQYHEVWNGRDDNGNATAAGVYYALLATAQGRFTRTVVVLR